MTRRGGGAFLYGGFFLNNVDARFSQEEFKLLIYLKWINHVKLYNARGIYAEVWNLSIDTV